ncbi:MAG: ABC transporter permease subunit [Chloroflexota bacterium]
MLSNVLLKTLRDQRKAFMWWSIGVGALVIITILFYPSLADYPEFDEMMERMPEAFAKLMMGEVSELTSSEGYLNSQLFVSFVPLLFLFFAIARGSSAIAGEEDRGTLDLLMSYPLRRSRVLMEKFAAMVVEILALGFVVWLSTAVGAVIVGMDISLVRIAEATLSGVLLGLAFGALALALGCAKSSRGLSVGVTSALAVAAYFVNALAPVVEALEPFRKLSPFYYYIGANPLSNGLDLAHAGVLIVLTAVFFTVALVTFERRDLAT